MTRASRGSGRTRRTAVLAAVLALFPAAAAVADVTPPSVTATLSPGDSLDVTKTVDVPENPPKADVYFLADTTGSMASVISTVRAGASTILGSLQGAIGDAEFGAGDYKDFPFDSYAFQNGAPIGSDDGVGGANDASDAIDGWRAGGGADGSEGQLYALDQIADDTTIGWRDETNRILVWFGDAPGHDPVCSAISGLPYDITEASATQKLVDAGITVVAISTTTGFPNALDDDPTSSASNYAPTCELGGSAGQATRIADATGGVHVTGIDPDAIVDTIIQAVESLTSTVIAEPVGCDPLEVTFDPPSHTDVAGGTSVAFVETVAVPASVTGTDLPAGGVVDCIVNFRANDAVIGTQDLSIAVVASAGAAVDIHPTSCPNPFKLGKNGVVPAAILGSTDTAVIDIDPTTVELTGPGGTAKPLRSSIEDAAAPDAFAEPEARTDCGTAGPDGYPDLTLKFKSSDVEAVVGDVAKGEVVVVEISAEIDSGSSISGADIIWIR